MEANLQRRIQRYGWDAAANVYESLWRENLADVHDTMLEMAALQPGEDVLEVACGSGFLTFPAAAIVGQGGTVSATDISLEMVDLLLSRAEQLACKNVIAKRADAEALDAPAESFDAALCALGLMYMPDPVEALRRMYQALKPGGRVVVSVWGERRNCGWADIFPVVDDVVQSEVCPLFFGLGAGESLGMAIEKAGFVNFQAKRINIDLRFNNSADTLEAMVDGGAVAMAAKRFDPAKRAQVEKAFLSSIEEYRLNGVNYKIPSEFVVGVGMKY